MFGSSATGSSGAGPVSRSVPRLAGRTIPPSSVKPFSGPSIHGSYIGTMKWIGWMSGTGSPGRERQKRCVWQAGRPGEGGPISRSALKITGESRWSCRFSPTPGRSATTSIPSERRCSAGPTPESRRSCADPIVPPHTTTCPARARSMRPSCDHSTPTQRVPSNSRRRAVAPVTSSRFASASTGRMYAAAVLWRTPSSMLYCMNDTPSCDAPL